MKNGKIKGTDILLVCAALLVVASVLFALLRPSEPYEESFFAMGTYVSARVYGSVPDGSLKEAVTECENELSHRINSSAVSRINNGESLEVSKELSDIFTLASKLKEQTGGEFDICMLALTSLWNFDSGLENIPDEKAIAEALKEKNNSGIYNENGEWSGKGIDLGSVGKGAACDRCAEVLKKNKASGVVAVGGSLACVGMKNGGNWTVAVRDPFSGDRNDTLLTLSLGECFVSTSGSYEKSFVTDGILYHHILSASTGFPAVGNLVSVTVVCDNGALSDALSTAFFLVGEENALLLAEQYGAQALFVRSDGTVFATAGLKDCVTVRDGTEIEYAIDG